MIWSEISDSVRMFFLVAKASNQSSQRDPSASFLDRRPKISPHFSQRLSTGNLRPGSRVVWILLLVCVFFFFLATNLHVTTRMIHFIEAQREFHCKNTERLEDPCLICWSFSRRQFCRYFVTYFFTLRGSRIHKITRESISSEPPFGRLDQSAFCEDSRFSHVSSCLAN